MNVRAVCEGEFTLPLAVAEAVPLFTPEGERRWAGASWDPVYPISKAVRPLRAGYGLRDGERRRPATWIVVEPRDDGLRYARIAPDRIAGTITVVCSEGAFTEETRVTVCYDVTSLGPDGVRFVEELQAGYDLFLADWRREILAGLGM